MVSGSGGIEASNRSAGIGPDNLPAPRVADLITDIAAFRQAPIEEKLAPAVRPVRRGGRAVGKGSERLFLLFAVALAVVAIEAARRWHRRSTREPSQSRQAPIS